MVYENRRHDVAVFIDFENVYVSVRDKLDANPNFESIMERCNDLGRVVIARAYADWYRYPRVTSALYANGIEPMYVPTYYYDKDMGRTGRAIKNSVDMNLCIDAMKTLFVHTNIVRFVLVTGDRDFIPLVNSIRQQGKEVIIIGIGGAASTHLAQSADEFVFYEQLVGRSIPTAAIRQRAKVATVDLPTHTLDQSLINSSIGAAHELDVYDVLVEAIHLVRSRGYVSTLGSLKLVMKELMGGDFKESRYKDLNGRPFGKFKDFVLDAERRGKVQIFTNGTVNEVFLPGEDPYKLSQFASELNEEPPEAGVDADVIGNGHRSEDHAETSGEPPGASPSRRRRRRSRSNRRNAQSDTDKLNGTGQAGSEDQLDVEQPEAPVLAQTGDEDAAPDSASESSELLDYDYETPIAATDELAALAELEMPAEIAALFEERSPAEIAGAGMPEEMRVPLRDDMALDLVRLPIEVPSSDEAAGADSAYDVPPTEEVHAAEAAPEMPGAAESHAGEAAPEPPVAEVEAPGAVAEPETLAESEDTEELALEEVLVFSDEEWQLFQTMMSQFPKPTSFAQIFDALRELRKQERLQRTNEQLRTMVKQAINNGLLERSGRGKRIYYTLRSEGAAQDGQPDNAEQPAGEDHGAGESAS